MVHNSFLRDLAELFYHQRGEDLYRYRFFFQNKRAGSFFKHYLKQQTTGKLLWLPETTTLYTFLERTSNMLQDDPNKDLLIIFHLYRCFHDAYPQTDHDFESFYDVGRQLLADFNDIDMHLGNAGEIFRNMDELDKLTINPKEYLNSQQIDALQRFVKVDLDKSFDRGYAEFWSKMPWIYHRLKQVLREEGLAYNGMLIRDILERLESHEIDICCDGKVNVFVGLNALSLSEQKLLKYFSEHSETLFYWDYDNDLLKKRYTDKARSENVRFPEPVGELAYNRNKEEKYRPKLEIISIPSKVAQSTYIKQEILPKVEVNTFDPNVAIVLPDESQLITLLAHLNLPKESINVTMGFPIKELPIVSKLLHVLKLQKIVCLRKGTWRRDELLELLSLHFVSTQFSIQDLLARYKRQKIFFTSSELKQQINADYPEILCLLLTPNNCDVFDNTLQLFSYAMHQNNLEETDLVALQMLTDLLNEQRASFTKFISNHSDASELVGNSLLFDLISTTIIHAKIPFEGEPLKGLQIMGLLEARSIDFETVIVLDTGEGLLPSTSKKYGLIPQGLRREYNLPTYQWQDDIRAYNFFHLLSRSTHLYALYDSRKNDRSSGESSRYLKLLTNVYNTPATYHEASFELMPFAPHSEDVTIDIEKRVAHYRDQITDPNSAVALSPSRILQYIMCPRRFYYETILGLREDEEVSEILDKKEEGTLIHQVLDRLYNDFEGKEVTQEMLRKVSDEDIKRAVLLSFGESIDSEDGRVSYNAILLEAVESIIREVINMDIRENAPFYYIGGEVPVKATYDFSDAIGPINLKGYIDRIDKKDGIIRLFDYKTGGDDFVFNLVDSFSPEKDKIGKAALQLFIYALIMLKGGYDKISSIESSKITTMLVKVRSREQGFFIDKSNKVSIPITSYSVIQERFEELLRETLISIVKTDEQFQPNPQKGGCDYCAAKKLCSSAVLKDFF